jgi:ABC-type bacteriocin/lantibiotic exporter with double-glycine peptidase domain
VIQVVDLRYFLVVVIGALSSASVRAVEAPLTEFDGWRVAQRCGVNVVYAYLKMHKVNITYAAILKEVPVDPVRGSSLKSVADCISSHGIQVKVGKTAFSELQGLEMPVIAHLEFDNPTSESVESSQVGHFVVVVSADDSTTRYLDGTFGTFKEVPTEEFVRSWSGYIVAQHADNTLPVGFAAALVTSLLTIVLITSLGPSLLRRYRKEPSSPEVRSRQM